MKGLLFDEEGVENSITKKTKLKSVVLDNDRTIKDNLWPHNFFLKQ